MDIKDIFKNTEKLYHFTSFDTALKIIESNKLKFGRLDNMNDIHENDKLMFVDTTGQPDNTLSFEVLDALHDEIYKYRQISLTMDDAKGKQGFDLHQMWGIYADKGNGVCLVFAKDELEKVFDDGIQKGKIDNDGKEKLESFVISNSQTFEDAMHEINNRAKDIFFTNVRSGSLNRNIVLLGGVLTIQERNI